MEQAIGKRLMQRNFTMCDLPLRNDGKSTLGFAITSILQPNVNCSRNKQNAKILIIPVCCDILSTRHPQVFNIKCEKVDNTFAFAVPTYTIYRFHVDTMCLKEVSAFFARKGKQPIRIIGAMVRLRREESTPSQIEIRNPLDRWLKDRSSSQLACSAP